MDEHILDSGEFEDGLSHSGKPEFYKSFYSMENAQEYVSILEEHKVIYFLEGVEALLDDVFVGQGLLPKVILKLYPSDFQRVNDLVAQVIEEAGDDILEGHYLNQFDDKELLEVLEKQDEWSTEDIQISQLLLKKRGIAVPDEVIRRKREARLEEIRQGKKGSRTMMFFYFLAIVLGGFISIFFPMAGIGMGYYYAYGKNVDIDGKRHFIFDEGTRQLGSWILGGGVVVLVLWVLAGLFLF